mgnify:CR=1 FL=1
MKCDSIDYASSHLVRPLIKDYLLEKETTQSLYAFAPTHTNLKKAIKERRSFPIDRNLLKSQLLAQYESLGKLPAATKKQINLLAENDTFTITTGHQLNLFGGSKYFIYKIVEVIKYTEQLKEEFPDLNFVPIFWMASEDHDFDEINHARIGDKMVSWTTEEKGAVGPFDPKEILPIVRKELDELWKTEPVTGSFLENLFSEAYHKPSLAEATRYWVHALFYAKGLVILDGNDKELKRAFSSRMKDELVEQKCIQAVEKTNEFLEQQDYHLQVFARPINVFHLSKEGRFLLQKDSNGYFTAENDKQWTQEELLAELDEYPERFSPNALMRPLYQECVLPNLAYVGGAGEIAYWLQLKSAFEAFDIFFPQAVVRNSFLFITERQHKKTEKLDIPFSKYFQKEDDFIVDFAENRPELPDIFAQNKAIQEAWKSLAKSVESSYPALKQQIEIQEASAHKELKRMRQEWRKNIKTKNAKELKILLDSYHHFFPNGSFQERYESFIPEYLAMGSGYFDILFDAIQPTKAEIVLIKY